MTEAAIVARLRSNRFSWQEVARSIGRPVESVRAEYDSTYSAAFVPAEPVPLITPRARVEHIKRAWDGMKTGERRQFIMDKLYASTMPVPMDELGGYTAADCIAKLRKKYGPDIIRSKQYNGYWLSDAGREVYERDFAKQPTSSAILVGSVHVEGSGQSQITGHLAA